MDIPRSGQTSFLWQNSLITLLPTLLPTSCCFPSSLDMSQDLILQSEKPLSLPLETHLGELEEFRKEALAAYEKAWRTIKEWISFKFHPWKSGDKVWLEGKNLKLHYPSKKLAPRRERPFEIIQVISLVAYKLWLPPTWKIYDVFHAFLLLSYRETLEHRPNFSNPPPGLIGEEEEYEIDKILSHHRTQGWR